LKHLNRDLGETSFVVLLGLALAAEFLISTEMYLDVLLVGAIALVAAAWLIPELRRRLRVTAVGTAIATGCSLLLVSPYLWHAFVTAGVESAPARAPFTESADLANYLVPTRRIWLQLPRSHEIAHRFTTTGAERGAYLGVPLTIIVLMFLWQNRRSRSAWAVACTLVAVIVASVGARVHVAGHATVPAPWRMFATLPVTKTVLPTRFTLFVILIVAVLVAKWLADGRGRRAWLRWALTAVAIIFVLPNPANGLWSATAPNPLFFKTTAYERHIPRGATVLVLPFGGAGWSLLWQAEDNFRYRLVDGHLGREVTPEEEPWRDVYFALGKGPTPPSVDQRLRAFLAAHHVAEIIVAAGAKPRVVRLVTQMGVKPMHAADVAIYRLP
jgi:hypothetical protein